MKKEIIKPGTKQFRVRSEIIYNYTERIQPSEATKEAFFRKPYGGLEKGKKKNE